MGKFCTIFQAENSIIKYAELRIARGLNGAHTLPNSPIVSCTERFSLLYQSLYSLSYDHTIGIDIGTAGGFFATNTPTRLKIKVDGHLSLDLN